MPPQLNPFMENTNYYIFGASGHGKVVADCLQSTQQVITGIIDDAPKPSHWKGIPILLSTDISSIKKPFFTLLAIGNNITRKAIANRYSDFIYGQAIHQSAQVVDTVSIGEGTVVFAQAVINADAVIGKHVIINTGAIVEHDCVLEDYVHVSPNAVLAGNVTVGEGTHIGASAVVIPGVTIGKWCTIGAGTVVIRDVPDGVTVVGNPGRIL
jgi:sugar O-acyltransferase (sialic acid O-acetyltransferase NeuD family)